MLDLVENWWVIVLAIVCFVISIGIFYIGYRRWKSSKPKEPKNFVPLPPPSPTEEQIISALREDVLSFMQERDSLNQRVGELSRKFTERGEFLKKLQEQIEGK